MCRFVKLRLLRSCSAVGADIKLCKRDTFGIVFAALLFTFTFCIITLSTGSNQQNAIATHRNEVNAQSVLHTFLLDTPLALLPVPRDRGNEGMINHERHLVFCWMPKNMCTQMKALFCRVYLDYKGDAASNPGEFEQIHDACFFYLSLVNRTNPWQLSDPTWLKWTIVRDPLERLLSAWLDKCSEKYTSNNSAKCYACNQDFDCFVRKNHIGLAERSLNMSDYYPEHFDHFWPQSWFCGYRHLFSRYDKVFVYDKSESFKQQIRSAFSEIGWGSFVQSGWGPKRNEPFLGHTTLHGTGVESSNVAEYFGNDLALVDLAFRTYFVDYISFALPKPKWTQLLCKKNADIASLYLICNSLTVQ